MKADKADVEVSGKGAPKFIHIYIYTYIYMSASLFGSPVAVSHHTENLVSFAVASEILDVLIALIEPGLVSEPEPDPSLERDQKASGIHEP